jgi:putative glutamine amidotransferase
MAVPRVRPFIGINSDYTPPTRTAGPQLRVHAGYAEKVYEAGGLPVIIPPGLQEQELDDLLDRLDGMVLIGSQQDMDPKRMGLNPHAAVTPMPARREDSDRLLCKLIIERQMPLLAVAVGMHELNVLCGGSLFLHLPEDMPKALPHRYPSGGPHRHAVLIEPNTRIDAIYGGGEIRVNSYHHQAVQNVAPKFKVSAKSPDGIIEAIEAEDPDWWCIGVQWHPHSETASALDMQLFEAFIAASAKRDAILSIAA